MTTKRCPRCAETKAIERFVRNRTDKSGHGSYCKPCHNEICADNRQKHHGSTRSFHLKRRYGVDASTVEWLKLQQAGVCAICRDGAAEHVDHGHANHQVRGLLCFNCNRGLGYLDDDIELICRAADYLEGSCTT